MSSGGRGEGECRVEIYMTMEEGGESRHEIPLHHDNIAINLVCSSLRPSDLPFSSLPPRRVKLLIVLPT